MNSDQQRAESGEGQAGEDGERVDEALVQDAEHDVDHHDRENQQDQQAALGILEGLGGAGEGGGDRLPAGSARQLAAPRHGVADRDAGGEVERHRHRRQLARVVDASAGPTLGVTVASAMSGTSSPVGERIESMWQGVQVALVLRQQLHHHPVLVAAG